MQVLSPLEFKEFTEVQVSPASGYSFFHFKDDGIGYRKESDGYEAKVAAAPYQYFDRCIIVKDVNDLLRVHPANIDDEIELGKNIYIIDSIDFDLGVYKLVATDDVAIHGFSQQLNLLRTNEDNTTIISTTANLFLFQIALQAEGTGSQGIEMIGATGFESLDMKYVEFRGNTKYGYLEGIRQGFWADGFSFNAKEGFTMAGTWAGGFTLRTSRIINTGNYILGAAPGLTLNSIRSDVFATVPGGAYAFDFDYDNFNNDEGYQITDGRFEGAGMMASTFTDVGRDVDEPEKSRKSIFKNNTGDGALNTYEGGVWRITSSANEVTTIIPAANTLVKLAGITTYSFMEHFIQTTDNAFIYNVQIPKEFIIRANIVLSGGANDQITVYIRQWDNSASAYINVISLPSEIQNLAGSVDREKYIFTAIASLDYLDRIEVWAENNTDNTNIRMLTPSQVIMTTR